MKKRLVTLFLAFTMMTTLLVNPAAGASTGFSDVPDRGTAAAIEVLRLMGVLDGYGDGTFRPNASLNRAQFCKMAVYAMDGSGELGKYGTVTVFPDVKPSFWATQYINLAAKGKHIISGYPDGRFYPERAVTAGQAVTILLRLLGYSDADMGGIWPISQMAMGESVGLTKGVGLSDGNKVLNRGQAAKLFLNFLRVETKSGTTYYTLSEETTLLSIDGGAGTMTVSGNKTYPMAMSKPVTSLVGVRGQVVLNKKGEALTFLPLADSNGGVESGAVIVQADRSTAGLEALTGGGEYQIFKNGIPATVADLCKYDVATWNEASRSVRVCDTRVTAYYENCSPNPDAPITIEVLGGTVFQVLPTAAESLANFKPGQVMTLLLTADGQVAGAVDPRSSSGNAVGIVSDDGTIRMLCGAELVELGITASEEYYGKIVRVASGQKDVTRFTVLNQKASSDLDVIERKLGSKMLAENVMAIVGSERTSLWELNQNMIGKAEIVYARSNWKDQIDLIVLKGDTADGAVYGRVEVHTEKMPTQDENGNWPGDEGYVATVKRETSVSVEYGNGQRIGPYKYSDPPRSGTYVIAKVNRGKTGYQTLSNLTPLADVSRNAWIGKKAVTVGGKTYTVPDTVRCYNADAQRWIALDAALAYTNTFQLYVEDTVIRVIEVKS